MQKSKILKKYFKKLQKIFRVSQSFSFVKKLYPINRKEENNFLVGAKTLNPFTAVVISII
jgi:hypothetical protein